MTAQLSLFDTAPVKRAHPNPINFIKADDPAPLKIETLSDAIATFLLAQEKYGRSKHTINAYRGDFKHLCASIGDNTPIAAVNENALNAFLNDRAKTAAPKTLERAITSMRSLFAWLTAEEILHHNPAAAVQYQPVPDTLPTLPTTQTLAAIIKAARAMDDPRPCALTQVILNTGIKKGEARRLELGDITDTYIIVKYTNPKMMWKSRRVPLTQNISADLWRYREAYPDTDAQNLWFPISPKPAELAITHAGTAAGYSGLTAETLRWLYAVNQVRAGLAPETLRNNLGLAPVAWHRSWKKIKALSRLYT